MEKEEISNEKIAGFGLLVGIVLACIGCWALWSHGETRLLVYMNVVIVSLASCLYMIALFVDREWDRREKLISLFWGLMVVALLNGVALYLGVQPI